MTTIQVQTQLPFETLLNSLKQLNLRELEDVAHTTAVLRARQLTPSLPKEEAALLSYLNEGVIPVETQQRCAVLSQKAQEGAISEEERIELLGLIDQIEELNSKRIGYLVQLAQLRQIPLDDLMKTLEIKPLPYA